LPPPVAPRSLLSPTQTFTEPFRFTKRPYGANAANAEAIADERVGGAATGDPFDAELPAFLQHVPDGQEIFLVAHLCDESIADTLAFTAIGVVTSDPASVESLLNWATQLQNRVSYLVVLNQQEDIQVDFTYWEKSAEAAAFRAAFTPPIIRMEARLPDLQHALRNHGFTLGKVAAREVSGTELSKSSLVVRAQAYRRQLFAEFSRVKEVLLP
jgi:hypothetical protein